MRRFILMLVILSPLLSMCQQNMDGNWLGSLEVGIKLRVVFHIKKDNNKFITTLDSPDQGAESIPCGETFVSSDSLTIDIPVIKGKYSGRIISDSVVVGSFFQNGQTLPLKLIKTNKVISSLKPQTPVPPFSYKSNSVEYSNETKSVKFGGTFTYPSAGGPFTTVLLITGSGQQDRDETVFNHKPFAVIADYLTKKGYAVLRVDDRGVGQTIGDLKYATTASFAQDVQAGIAYLKTRKDVNPAKIGLIGHSEGGLIADMVAADNKDIAFIVTLAGPGIKGSEILIEQIQAGLEKDSVSAKAINAQSEVYRMLFSTMAVEKDTSKIFYEVWRNFQTWKSKQDAATLKELNITSDNDSQGNLRAMIRDFSNPWIRYFIKTDPVSYIEKLTCKVLALNGEKDIQVLAKSNLPAIKAALAKSQSPSYEVKELPGLNHLFQHCSKCDIAEYVDLDETFSPEALDIIGKWMDGL
ncbi:alpha/beta hydrolase [Danxiaibacter flavus]|uniref:Alpha/beta hydrolase n=1 Tax=Danxiaibacter flavus TaxID=3049108 RepID=A0ABV3ZJR0_9BACT|nr:alpha/beta hydrolase [Chitinophagaceae bacterium DXS]